MADDRSPKNPSEDPQPDAGTEVKRAQPYIYIYIYINW